jgi:curved DNA-binding protein CbpA
VTYYSIIWRKSKQAASARVLHTNKLVKILISQKSTIEFVNKSIPRWVHDLNQKPKKRVEGEWQWEEGGVRIADYEDQKSHVAMRAKLGKLERTIFGMRRWIASRRTAIICHDDVKTKLSTGSPLIQKQSMNWQQQNQDQ